MVEFVLIGLLGLDQDHSFHLVVIKLSFGDGKGDWLKFGKVVCIWGGAGIST